MVREQKSKRPESRVAANLSFIVQSLMAAEKIQDSSFEGSNVERDTIGDL